MCFLIGFQRPVKRIEQKARPKRKLQLPKPKRKAPACAANDEQELSVIDRALKPHFFDRPIKKCPFKMFLLRLYKCRILPLGGIHTLRVLWGLASGSFAFIVLLHQSSIAKQLLERVYPQLAVDIFIMIF